MIQVRMKSHAHAHAHPFFLSFFFLQLLSISAVLALLAIWLFAVGWS